MSVQAQTTLYWDLNVDAAGSGSATPSATWSTSGADKNWSTSPAGTSGGGQKWTDGNFAVFSAGSDATGAYTVTVSGTRNVAGITVEDGSPTFTGGTLNFNGATSIFTVNGSISQPLVATVSSNITGTNGLTKSGLGTLVFDTTAKTYSGTTTVSAGTLQLNASNLINNNSALVVSSGASFLFNWGVSETVASLAGAGTVDIKNGTFTLGDASNTTFSGVLGDSGGYGTLVKQGTGTLTLTGANTYNGVTTINAGAIIAASNTALGAATYGNTIASGAALQLQGGISLTEGSFTVTGTGVGGTGAIRNLSGNNTLDASLDLGGNTTVTSDAGTMVLSGQVNLGTANILTVAGTGNTDLAGSINNTGAITKTGTGTLTFSGTGANSFGGALNINDGTVLLNKTAGTNAVSGSAINVGDGTGATGSAILRLGASNQIANYAGTITIKSDGLFDVNNQTEAIDRLAGNGRINLGASGTLTVGVNSGNSTFGGSILGAGTLIKAGAGSLTLAASLALTGEFQLNSGTVFLSGYNLTAGTLHITGNSTIDFAGGNSTLNAANFIIDAGVTLTIANWTNAADFFFAQNWSGAAYNVSGAAPENQVAFAGYSANNTKWQAYDSQITPVPEASSYGALLLAAATALLVRHRRRITPRAG